MIISSACCRRSCGGCLFGGALPVSRIKRSQLPTSTRQCALASRGSHSMACWSTQVAVSRPAISRKPPKSGSAMNKRLRWMPHQLKISCRGLIRHQAPTKTQALNRERGVIPLPEDYTDEDPETGGVCETRQRNHNISLHPTASNAINLDAPSSSLPQSPPPPPATPPSSPPPTQSWWPHPRSSR